MRIGTHGLVHPHYPIPLRPNEGAFVDLDHVSWAVFILEDSPDAHSSGYLDGSNNVVPYFLSGQTDVPHEYCEPIVCQAMDEVSRRFHELSPNEDPEPLLQEVENTIGTECVLSPERPVPAAGGP